MRNRLKRFAMQSTLFNEKVGHSDSEATFYIKALESILKNKKRQIAFRRIYDYREILEHVDYQLGKEYLNQIKQKHPRDWQELVRLNLKNDNFGKPRRYKYKNIDRVSPTTLRYIATGLDIGREFSLQGNEVIAEIGVGYGGQASVLNRLFGIKKFYFFDLHQALEIAHLYLQNTNHDLICKNGDLKDEKMQYDLVISNYAFSELAIDLQNIYLNNVILKSGRGYMIMNSGKENISGRTTNKMKLNELLELIPNSKIKDEIPKTGPDNYVLTWGN